MKPYIKTLCSIGALMLCSESVLAAKIPWYKDGTSAIVQFPIYKKYQLEKAEASYRINEHHEASVTVKGPLCKNDQLKSDPFVVVRRVTFDGNNLEKFTPKIENWLKKQGGLQSLSVQNNKFEELPEEIMEWFPHLKQIYFWDNPIKKSPDFLLYMGSLEVVSGTTNFADNTREGLNKNRQYTINRYKGKLQGVENLISEKEEELSVLQTQLESLNKIELNLKKAKASKRQRKFIKRGIKKGEKALAQQKEALRKLLEKKSSFENVISKLEKAQKKSLEIAERKSRR